MVLKLALKTITKVCKLSFIQDGGLLTNSPCALAIHEAKLIWPATPIQCVVSLGTGIYHSPSRRVDSTFSSLREKLLKVVASATDTEGGHNSHISTFYTLRISSCNSHVLVKRKQELHESWQARVHIWVLSTLMSWSNENKSCMRVGHKREFAWEFCQLSCPGQTRTRVVWELTSESLHESFVNSRVLVKREQELYESWQARVCVRLSSTLMSWSNENKSCMRVDKREFTWEFHQLSCPGQTRTRVAWELTSESLHESFINSHVLVKREQELHESWQARVYMRVPSTLMSWSNGNKSCSSSPFQPFIQYSKTFCQRTSTSGSTHRWRLTYLWTKRPRKTWTSWSQMLCIIWRKKRVESRPPLARFRWRKICFSIGKKN